MSQRRPEALTVLALGCSFAKRQFKCSVSKRLWIRPKRWVERRELGKQRLLYCQRRAHLRELGSVKRLVALEKLSSQVAILSVEILQRYNMTKISQVEITKSAAVGYCSGATKDKSLYSTFPNILSYIRNLKHHLPMWSAHLFLLLFFSLLFRATEVSLIADAASLLLRPTKIVISY